MKKAIIALSILLSLSFVQTSQAQDTISEENFISFSVLGTSSYFGVTYERMLTSKWAAEIGLGVLSIGFGATYYPWEIKEDDVSFYTGVKYSSPNIITALFLIPEDTDSVVYIPLGFTYATSGGFSLGLDVGPSLTGGTGIFGNVRAGFRF
jgi:hypothetical protein